MEIKQAPSNKKQRSLTLDIAKCVAIIMVIVGHSIQYGFGLQQEQQYYYDTIFKLIYTLHMPLFMLISGYLSCNSIHRFSTFELGKKRFQNYIIPILIWGTINCVLTLIMSRKLSFSTLVSGYWGAFWFIWSVFLCTILVSLIEKYASRYSVAIYIVIYVLTFVTPDLALQKFMYPFFVLGFLFNKWNVGLKMERKHHIISFAASLAVYIVLFHFYNKNSYIYTSGYTLLPFKSFNSVATQLGTDLFRTFIGIVGAVSVLYFCWGISRAFRKNTALLKPFVWMGQNSIALYIISTIIYYYIFKMININLEYNIIMLAFLSMAVIVISSLLTWLFMKSKFLARILFGKF